MAPKLTEKDGEAIIKQGMLRKQGGQYKSWKDRWFTLTKDHFSYYKAPESEEPIKRILLKDVNSCQVENADRVPSRFPFFFSVATETRTFMISSRSEQERNEWIAAINSVTHQNTKPSTPTPQKDPEALSLASIAESLPEIIKPFTPKSRPQSTCRKSLEHEFSFEEFVSNFKDFVRNQNLSDISYSVQDQLFAAHKAIIACRCPILSKSFPSKSNSVVAIDGVKPETFSSILDYIYTGEVELNSNNVVDIHFAAVAYELHRLKDMCEVFIREKTDVSNVLVMLVAANKLQEDELQRFLLGYMKDVTRYTSIIKQPQASEIAQTNKDLYVNMSQVLAQPDESFRHNLDQVTVEPNLLTEDIYRLLTTLEYSDVRIITKDGEVFAHRIILAARCNAFLEEGSLGFDDDKSFTPPTKFQTLKFTSLEPQVIYLLLQTLYSNKIKLNYLEDTYGLIELADRVQQEHIVSVCNDMMQQNLQNETALKILMVSSEYELLELKKETLALIAKESESILKRKELRSILSQWPWNLIDIIRVLVHEKEINKGVLQELQFTDEEEEEEDNDNNYETDEEEEDPSTELS